MRSSFLLQNKIIMKIKSWYNSVAFTVLLHFTFWSAFILLPFFLRSNVDMVNAPPTRGFQHTLNVIRRSLPLTIFFNLIDIGFFYLNALVLMPRFLIRRKPLKYALITAVAVAVFTYGLYYFRLTLTGKEFVWRFPVFSFLEILFFLTVSMVYRFLSERSEYEKLAQHRENENLKTELLFLRNQISPHFMFNVINNIVALSRTQPAQVETFLIRLSELMRYMLYETQTEKVSLQKELHYLENYIHLQKLRFDEDVQVNYTNDCNDKSRLIEPMLLIPFVENAFKHGGNLNGPTVIEIAIAQKNDKIIFRVSNTFIDSPRAIKDESSGIGLQNVKRRLKLLYQNNHLLTFNISDNTYKTELILDII